MKTAHTMDRLNQHRTFRISLRGSAALLFALNAPLPADESERFPPRLSQTGVFTDLTSLSPRSDLITYEVNVPFWSDGASKQRWIALPQGTRIGFSATGEWTFPPGTLFVKHFERDRRLETRLLVYEGDHQVFGAAYRWQPDDSDADRIDQPTERDSWHYPGPEECRKCHVASAGGVLGVNTRQLNRSATSATGEMQNQLAIWSRRGLFDSPLDLTTLPRLSGPDVGSIEDRARSYLDANCGYCHRPGGVVADFDARFSTPLNQQNLIDAPVRINLGIDRARFVAPNDIWRSFILVRMNTRDGSRMPPLGHCTIDEQGISLLRQWIGSLSGPTVLAPPDLSPSGAEFNAPVQVTLHHDDSHATLHYTLDGSVPTASSPEYAGPIRLARSATLRARAFRHGFTKSITVNETYIIEPGG